MLLLATLPFTSAFRFDNYEFTHRIKDLIGNAGVISLAEIKTGKLFCCTNLNLATQHFPIGSLSKIIIATALLEKGIITSEDIYNCRGRETIFDKEIKCWVPGGHGRINVETAIAESCNLFFYGLMIKMKPEDIHNTYSYYHLNRTELPPEYHKDTIINFPDRTTAGESILILYSSSPKSPLQMLNLACTLGRNGIYKPLWIKKPILNEYKTNISPSTLSIVRNGMIKSARSGTAKLLYKKGFNAATKTGSAPFTKDQTHGWCIGYIPINHPQIAFSVFIKKGTGFSDAVPITSKVLKLCKDFQYL